MDHYQALAQASNGAEQQAPGVSGHHGPQQLNAPKPSSLSEQAPGQGWGQQVRQSAPTTTIEHHNIPTSGLDPPPVAGFATGFEAPAFIRTDDGSQFTQQEREQLAQSKAVRNLQATPRMTATGNLPDAITMATASDAVGAPATHLVDHSRLQSLAGGGLLNPVTITPMGGGAGASTTYLVNPYGLPPITLEQQSNEEGWQRKYEQLYESAQE